MPRRSLPTAQEALRILGEKRTRPQRRPPRPARTGAFNKTLKRFERQFGQGASGLIARWREVVGVEIARRTEPVKLTKGRNGGPSSLEIRVAGPAAAIIQHQAHEILARVNLFLGAEAVQKLRIVQGPLQRPAGPAPCAPKTAAPRRRRGGEARPRHGHRPRWAPQGRAHRPRPRRPATSRAIDYFALRADRSRVSPAFDSRPPLSAPTRGGNRALISRSRRNLPPMPTRRTIAAAAPVAACLALGGCSKVAVSSVDHPMADDAELIPTPR